MPISWPRRSMKSATNCAISPSACTCRFAPCCGCWGEIQGVSISTLERLKLPIGKALSSAAFLKAGDHSEPFPGNLAIRAASLEPPYAVSDNDLNVEGCLKMAKDLGV